MWVQKVPGGGVSQLTFSPDGRTLYTLDGGGWLTAWDVATHAGRRLAHGPWSRADFPRGLSALTDGKLVVRAESVSVVDPGGEVLESISPPGLTHHIYAQVRPDGRVYYSGPSRSVVGWDLLRETPVPGFTVPEVPGVVTIVNNFELSPDGSSVAVTFYAGYNSAYLYALADDGSPHDPVRVSDVGPIARVRFSPSGEAVVATWNYPARLAVWDVRTKTVRAKGVPFSPTHGLFAFNPAYPLFAALREDETLAVWSLETGQPLRTVDFALGRAVRCAAFSPDGLTCAVGGSNKQFAVFDVDV